jgi:hypothetical protein
MGAVDAGLKKGWTRMAGHNNKAFSPKQRILDAIIIQRTIKYL